MGIKLAAHAAELEVHAGREEARMCERLRAREGDLAEYMRDMRKPVHPDWVAGVAVGGGDGDGGDGPSSPMWRLGQCGAHS